MNSHVVLRKGGEFRGEGKEGGMVIGFDLSELWSYTPVQVEGGTYSKEEISLQ